jgi:hypothetical protein
VTVSVPSRSHFQARDGHGYEASPLSLSAGAFDPDASGSGSGSGLAGVASASSESSRLPVSRWNIR